MSGDVKAELKTIAAIVKALINSRKQPVFISDIIVDYAEVEGRPLPFRKLGFKTPQELLQATGEILLTPYGNDVCVTASNANTKSQHIMKFVRSQKPSKNRHIHSANKIRKPANYNKPYNPRPYRKRGGPGPKQLSSANQYSGGGGGGDRNNNTSRPNSYNTMQSSNHGSYNGKGRSFEEKPKDSMPNNRPSLKQAKPPSKPSQPGQQQQQSKQTKPSVKFDPNCQHENVNDKNKQNNNQNHYQKEKNNPPPLSKPSKVGKSVLQDRLNILKPEVLDMKKIEEHIMLKKKELEDFQESLDAKKQEIQVESTPLEAPLNGNPQEFYEKQFNLNHQLHYQKKVQEHQNIIQRQNQIYETNMQRYNYYQLKTTAKVHEMQNTKKSVQDRLKIAKDENDNNHDDANKINQELSFKTQGLKLDKEKDASIKILDNAEQQLNKLCREMGYEEPEYLLLRHRFMQKLIGTVTVDGKIYSTYPQEYEDEDVARQAAASVAVKGIKSFLTDMSLPPCSFGVQEFIDHLHAQLFKHPTGIFAKDIVDWYQTTVKERIHDNWWTLVQISNVFRTEDICDNIIIFALDKKPEQSTISCLTTNDVVFYIPPIELPWYDDCWSLFVTFCDKTTEIWARLYGTNYSQKYEHLLSQIEEYMGEDPAHWKRPPAIEAKQICLVHTINVWHRVRIESIDKEKNQAFCYFIDFGDSDNVEVDSLYLCIPKFYLLPAQAVRFSLYGLEDFVDHPKARAILEKNLSLKSVVAKIYTSEQEYLNVNPEIGGKLKAVFYDTSTPDLDINWNDELIQAIAGSVSYPELKSTAINLVEVSHITDLGELYIRIRNENLKYIENILQKIGSWKNLGQHKATLADMEYSTKFLFCDKSNKNFVKWYRGSLKPNARMQPNSMFVELFCIDAGKMCNVHMDNIYRLESLSAALSAFPPQALKVRLFNIIDMKPSMVGRLRALLPLNSEVLAKVGKIKHIPLVTFYVRQNNILVNINENLLIEQELEGWQDKNFVFSGYDDDNRSESSRSEDNFSNPSSKDVAHGLLVAPPLLTDYKHLPPIEKITELPICDQVCLQVRVTLVANPWNFMVQPYEKYKELKNMMHELQLFCLSHDELIPSDMIEEGQYYAAKHSDGYFHRVKIIQVFPTKIYHVYYIDLGDKNTLRGEQLKVLPKHFRKLPEMALPAKMDSLSPIEGNSWGSKECFRFRELTIGRPFIGVVTKIRTLPLEGEGRCVLLDELIDVVDSQDILIGDLMVAENLALKI